MTPLDTLDDASQRAICGAFEGFMLAEEDLTPAVRGWLAARMAELLGEPPHEPSQRLTPHERLRIATFLGMLAADADMPAAASQWLARQGGSLLDEWRNLRDMTT